MLELERDPEGAAAVVLAEVRGAAREDDVGSVVLGCAGMSAVAARLKAETPLPLIDSVVSAARLAAAEAEAPADAPEIFLAAEARAPAGT